MILTFFICRLVIYVSSFEKCLFIIFAHFLTGLFRLVLSFLRSLCILDTNPLSDTVGKYFLQFCWLPFHFVNRFLCCTSASKVDVIPFVHLCLYWRASRVFAKRFLPVPMSYHVTSLVFVVIWYYQAVDLDMWFIVSQFLNRAKGRGLVSYFCIQRFKFSQHHLLKRLSFLQKW